MADQHQNPDQARFDKRTYSVEEIAKILNISKRSAYRLCNEDLFRVVRIGTSVRINIKSFDDWLDGNA